MKSEDVSLLDEVFTHIDEHDRHQTSWNSTALFKRCQVGDIPLGRVPVDKEHAEFCVEHRGVEQDRIEVLVANVEYLKKPILFVEMPDGSHLLVDGTHRYVVYYAMKLPTIACYMIPYAIAKDFIIEGLPQTTEERLMAYSHLTEFRKVFGAGE